SYLKRSGRRGAKTQEANGHKSAVPVANGNGKSNGLASHHENGNSSSNGYHGSMYRSLKDWHDQAMSLGDPRLDGWLLMDSPVPPALLSILYVVLVLAGMRWMKGRNPFDIRPLMVVYNLSMVVFSAWLVYEFCVSGWLTGYSLGCQPVDFSRSPKAIRMAKACWWFFFSKYIEMLDTFFFVLRGRFELVTFLHVFHHAVVPPSAWWGVKFVPGGFSTFATMLNSVVHVVMYLYYGLAAMGPSVQPYLWWKRYLTKFQMVQFVTIVIHGMQLYFIECDYPKAFANAIMTLACIFFVLFANFYIQAYLKRSGGRRSVQKKQSAHQTVLVANGHSNGRNGAAHNGHHEAAHGVSTRSQVSALGLRCQQRKQRRSPEAASRKRPAAAAASDAPDWQRSEWGANSGRFDATTACRRLPAPDTAKWILLALLLATLDLPSLW
uniref:Elongation of very long chain fatty acids protein n=1 Tax=Macrostomum lignano TaxID=282301 RepID=A0A1I8J4D0_9PLAT